MLAQVYTKLSQAGPVVILHSSTFTTFSNATAISWRNSLGQGFDLGRARRCVSGDEFKRGNRNSDIHDDLTIDIKNRTASSLL
jgi:hypothetical protein